MGLSPAFHSRSATMRSSSARRRKTGSVSSRSFIWSRGDVGQGCSGRCPCHAAIRAAQQSAYTGPIVALLGDLVAAGFVRSLAVFFRWQFVRRQHARHRAVPSPGRRHGQSANLGTGRCRPPLAVVQKSTDAEQKRRKRISFLAEIEEPYSDQNAYHGHGYNFEHGVRSGTVQRIARGARGRGPLFANAPSANSIASTPSRTVSQPSTSIILSLRGRSKLQRSP